MQLLSTLLSEVLSIMRDSGQSFVLYISDLIGRCKLQKSLLHSLVANVYDMRTKFPGKLYAIIFYGIRYLLY